MRNVEWGNRKYFKKCQWHGQKEFKKHSVTAGFLLFFAWRLSLFVKHQRLTLLYAEYFWNFFKLFVKRQRFFIKSCRHWSRATWNEKLYKMCIKISLQAGAGSEVTSTITGSLIDTNYHEGTRIIMKEHELSWKFTNDSLMMDYNFHEILNYDNSWAVGLDVRNETKFTSPCTYSNRRRR